ncbi:hypothetical protein THO17_10780 [Marinomonas sp. THO17]
MKNRFIDFSLRSRVMDKIKSRNQTKRLFTLSRVNSGSIKKNNEKVTVIIIGIHDTNSEELINSA